MLRKILVTAIIIVALAGCESTKKLPGDFQLMKWEDGKTFYVTGPGILNQEGGGAIEGTVTRLAWNGQLIVAERYSTFRGDPDGWMVIDIKTKKVSGPISQSEFEAIVAKHHLGVKTAEEAWQLL